MPLRAGWNKVEEKIVRGKEITGKEDQEKVQNRQEKM